MLNFFFENLLRGGIDVKRRAEARGVLLGVRGGRWGCKAAAAAAAAAADIPKRVTVKLYSLAEAQGRRGPCGVEREKMVDFEAERCI